MTFLLTPAHLLTSFHLMYHSVCVSAQHSVCMCDVCERKTVRAKERERETRERGEGGKNESLEFLKEGGRGRERELSAVRTQLPSLPRQPVLHCGLLQRGERILRNVFH